VPPSCLPRPALPRFSRRLASSIVLLASLLLAGCPFFLPPDEPPTPGTNPSELSCGDVWTVDGLTGADSVALDIPIQTNFELVANFGTQTLSMRLTRQSDSAIERSLLLWDPLNERGVIPGVQTSEDDLRIELLGTSSLFSGQVIVDCSQPAENCFNLSDDDGDGLVDCADLNCAWDAGCLAEQSPFAQHAVGCEEGSVSLSTGLGPTDAQHGIYRTLPTSESAIGLEFWGGAELVLSADSAGGANLEITASGPGLLCFPEPDQNLGGDTILCEATEQIDGTAFLLNAEQLPVILEPLAPGWSNVEVIPDCAAE
jgi:hypothetical protein